MPAFLADFARQTAATSRFRLTQFAAKNNPFETSAGKFQLLS